MTKLSRQIVVRQFDRQFMDFFASFAPLREMTPREMTHYPTDGVYDKMQNAQPLKRAALTA